MSVPLTASVLVLVLSLFWVLEAKYLLVLPVLLYALYAVYVFQVWSKAFAGHRLSRDKEGSPSNKQPPDIKSFQENKKKTLHNAAFHQAFDTCELLHDLADLEVTKKENQIIRNRMNRTNSLTPAKLKSQELRELGSLADTKAASLNMDHIYISFSQFLWAYTFIGPNSYFLWLKGITFLQIRTFLHKRGIIKPKPFVIEELIATMCLEQTQAIHYYARTKKGSKLGNVAGFFFANFPYLDEDGEYQVADLLAVDIDLDTKRFLKAKFDDENLTASETLILLWYNTVAAQHVKLHSLANWGVNLSDAIKDTNPFLLRNSLVTTVYNYFGYSCFHNFMEGWEKKGLLSPNWNPNEWVNCVNHGIDDNIWQHSQIDELVPYSRFVNFVVKVRAIFFSEFAKHKDLFPGIHGEAMFVGTILHSLDHTLMDWNLEDPLWLDVDDPRFGRMAEIGRIIKVGFVKDVPFLYFHKRFKGSGHPFYDAVYEKAAKVDKKLADNMDTCIIK
jgi:hypothetical protein